MSNTSKSLPTLSNQNCYYIPIKVGTTARNAQALKIFSQHCPATRLKEHRAVGLVLPPECVSRNRKAQNSDHNSWTGARIGPAAQGLVGISRPRSNWPEVGECEDISAEKASSLGAFASNFLLGGHDSAKLTGTNTLNDIEYDQKCIETRTCLSPESGIDCDDDIRESSAERVLADSAPKSFVILKSYGEVFQGTGVVHSFPVDIGLSASKSEFLALLGLSSAAYRTKGAPRRNNYAALIVSGDESVICPRDPVEKLNAKAVTQCDSCECLVAEGKFSDSNRRVPLKFCGCDRHSTPKRVERSNNELFAGVRNGEITGLGLLGSGNRKVLARTTNEPERHRERGPCNGMWLFETDVRNPGVEAPGGKYEERTTQVSTSADNMKSARGSKDDRRRTNSDILSADVVIPPFVRNPVESEALINNTNTLPAKHDYLSLFPQSSKENDTDQLDGDPVLTQVKVRVNSLDESHLPKYCAKSTTEDEENRCGFRIISVHSLAGGNSAKRLGERNAKHVSLCRAIPRRVSRSLTELRAPATTVDCLPRCSRLRIRKIKTPKSGSKRVLLVETNYDIAEPLPVKIMNMTTKRFRADSKSIKLEIHQVVTKQEHPLVAHVSNEIASTHVATQSVSEFRKHGRGKTEVKRSSKTVITDKQTGCEVGRRRFSTDKGTAVRKKTGCPQSLHNNLIARSRCGRPHIPKRSELPQSVRKEKSTAYNKITVTREFEKSRSDTLMIEKRVEVPFDHIRKINDNSEQSVPELYSVAKLREDVQKPVFSSFDNHELPELAKSPRSISAVLESGEVSTSTSNVYRFPNDASPHTNEFETSNDEISKLREKLRRKEQDLEKIRRAMLAFDDAPVG